MNRETARFRVKEKFSKFVKEPLFKLLVNLLMSLAFIKKLSKSGNSGKFKKNMCVLVFI